MDLTFLSALSETAIAWAGKPVQIYADPFVRLTDANVVPEAVTLVGSTTASFQFGKAAQDLAASVGIFNKLVGLAVFPASAAALLSDRCLVLDAAQTPWLVMGEPTPNEGQTLFTLQCLVMKLQIRPDGLPAIP